MNDRFEELVAKGLGAKIVKEEETPTSETAQKETQKETVSEKVETKEEKKEEVKEEVTSEESSLKEGDSSPEEEKNNPTEGEAVTQQPNFDELLSEKTDGQFKNYDELLSVLSKEETPSVEFANEQMARLNDYVNKGGKMEDFFSTQMANYEEMSDEAIVKNHMKFQNPELSMEDISLLYEDSYKLDEDEYTDKEVKLSKIKLKQKASQAYKELTNFQKDTAIPAAQKDAEAEKAAVEQNQKKWKSQVTEVLKDFNTVDFDLNDKGDKYTFKVSDDSMKYVTNTTLNLPDFWKRYVNEDGTENVSKLAKEMAILDNVDSIVRSAYAQGKSGGKEDVIKDIKNPSYTPESKSENNKPLSIQDQINQELSSR
jgi:hypothetical protein